MQIQQPEELLELGQWIGRKKTLASLAGGSSAADAECLRRLRQEKKYRTLGLTWEQFCKQRIGMTQPVADKIIRRLEEFGPQYFWLAQATGITAEEYRRLAGSLVERGAEKCLPHAGELIPITTEDAPRLIAAVEELRRRTKPPRAKQERENPDQAIENLVRMVTAAVTEIIRVKRLHLTDEQSEKLNCKLIAQWRRLGAS